MRESHPCPALPVQGLHNVTEPVGVVGKSRQTNGAGQQNVRPLCLEGFDVPNMDCMRVSLSHLSSSRTAVDFELQYTRSILTGKRHQV